MNVATVVMLLSFCATLALPVPIDKSDQGRVERTISVEELESELEEIEDHVDAVRKKVKETATASKGPSTDIFSTPSAETTVPINEKIEITTPTLKPTNQTISTISPTLTGSNSTVVKIQVEKLQPEVVVKENKGEEKSKIEIKVEKLTPSGKDEIQVEKVTPAPSEAGENTGDTVSVEKVSAGEETKQDVAEESIRGKIQVTKIATGSAPVEKVDEISVEKVQIEQKEEQKEEEKGASAESVVVEEVERKKESEEKPPAHISVKKTANDEELDLEVEGIRKNKPYISVEKISPDDRQTNVKKKETSKKSIVVEKINEEENKKETKPLIQISVEKMKNEEDLDLAIGNTKKSNNKETVISVEEVSPTEKATEVKVKLTPTTVSVEVEKVNEVEEDNRPHEITAKKVQNDDDEGQGKETEESEEEDLEKAAVGKGNTKSEKAKQALVKEEKKKTNTISVQVTEQKASNDESEEKSLNLERRDMINNEKEKEDKSVVKKSEENVKVAVKKVDLVQPRIKTGSRNNQDIKQEAAEEEDLQMKPQMETSPAESDKAQSKKVEKVQSATPSDEDVLDDANDNRDEEKELEDEQEVLTEKETPEERKIAQAFDKALDKERNKARNMKTEAPTTHSSIPTTKKQSTKTRETGPQKERVKPSSKAKSKGDLSIEELELAALAEKTLNEDDTKEAKVFVSTQTSPTTAVKEKKNPEATVAVTKETTKPLLSGKETAKEEKKLKEELAIETKLEKTGHPPLIEVAKITEKPSMEPTTEIVEEDPDMNHNKEITNNETKKEPVPAGQDSEDEQERQLEN
ncbi:unnamed protein product [Porites evermanni]|uniref:Uncharacterized protein n=1 Tax=Porites evermanni TaxID=104178 RepID=A0ABN8LAM8_9CNID|nr:unnamed protein product [Porites evermanni]